MVDLSAVIITLNEEMDIADCIESVSWCKEILVVDSGSSDKTIQIAASLGARVIHHDFRGFGAQKQFGVDSAKYDWILSIDADERVSPELRACIQRLPLEDIDTAGYLVERIEFFQGRELKYGRARPRELIRLFHRGRGRFSAAVVHEEVCVDGPTETCDGKLLHNSYRSLSEYFTKFNHYTSLHAQERFEKGERTRPWRILISFPKALVNALIIQRGVLDGYKGILMGILHAFYTMIKLAKLYEMQKEQHRK